MTRCFLQQRHRLRLLLPLLPLSIHVSGMDAPRPLIMSPYSVNISRKCIVRKTPHPAVFPVTGTDATPSTVRTPIVSITPPSPVTLPIPQLVSISHVSPNSSFISVFTPVNVRSRVKRVIVRLPDTISSNPINSFTPYINRFLVLHVKGITFMKKVSINILNRVNVFVVLPCKIIRDT